MHFEESHINLPAPFPETLFCSLNDPAVTGIATCSLRLADNLNDLATAQTKVAGDRVGDLYTGQLGLLQTIALEELALLLRAEQDVLGDQFVAGDVDEQILFLEVLTDAARDAGKQAHGRGRDRGLRDEDTGVEVVLIDKVVEGAHLLCSDSRGVGAEVDVDCTAVWLGVWVSFAGKCCVLQFHGIGGAGLDFHLGATVVAEQFVSDVFSMMCVRVAQFQVFTIRRQQNGGRKDLTYSG